MTLVPDLEKDPHAWAMTWNLVEVWEPEPPPGTEPVHWLLWTLEPAATLAEALEVVRKSTCRWPIEEFHWTLKSGCRVEDVRLETWDGLEKAVTVNAEVAAGAWRCGTWRGDPRRPGVGAVQRGRGRGVGVPLRQGDEAVRTDDPPGGLVDRPAGRPPEPQR